MAMPNDCVALKNRKEIWVCENHSVCEWMTEPESKLLSQSFFFFSVIKSCLKQSQEKKRPSQPSFFFSSVTKPCLNQSQEAKIATEFLLADAQMKYQRDIVHETCKILDFKNLMFIRDTIAERFHNIKTDYKVSMYLTYMHGRKTIMFSNLKKVLYVLAMSRTLFRVNPHSIVA